jgi:hypothetical protein
MVAKRLQLRRGATPHVRAEQRCAPRLYLQPTLGPGVKLHIQLAELMPRYFMHLEDGTRIFDPKEGSCKTMLQQ